MDLFTIMVVGIIILLLAGFFSMGVAVYLKQKSIDAPFKGILIVDKQDIEGPSMVYLQAMVDPGTFTDGEEVKLRVRLVKPKSQGKQG